MLRILAFLVFIFSFFCVGCFASSLPSRCRRFAAPTSSAFFFFLFLFLLPEKTIKERKERKENEDGAG